MSGFDPVRIIEALAEAEVDFILIGQAAAFLQGNPVATVDLDIMPRRDLDNADRLAAALNSLHARRSDGHETELEGAEPHCQLSAQPVPSDGANRAAARLTRRP